MIQKRARSLVAHLFRKLDKNERKIRKKKRKYGFEAIPHVSHADVIICSGKAHSWQLFLSSNLKQNQDKGNLSCGLLTREHIIKNLSSESCSTQIGDDA